jgi:hypothetical protein
MIKSTTTAFLSSPGLSSSKKIKIPTTVETTDVLNLTHAALVVLLSTASMLPRAPVFLMIKEVERLAFAHLPPRENLKRDVKLTLSSHLLAMMET